jgi:radical SAM protein with 4Fe4S-binding SPASM domain
VIDAVVPHYHARFPKPRVGGWGRRSLNVTPSGRVLPCHAAESIPGLEFWNVREHSLAEIWELSPAFNAFRGTDFLPEPCASCERREIDFGGCRCQAFLLAGDARQPTRSATCSASRALSSLRGARGRAFLPAMCRRLGCSGTPDPIARRGNCPTLSPRKLARACAALPCALKSGFRIGGVHVHFDVVPACASPGRSHCRREQPPAAQPPGLSPLDKSNPAASKQDSNLKPHPTPPIGTAVDKLPLDKIKLPAGFKVEVYSSGHPGGRTMVMGNKGTLHGLRIIGRVYAVTNRRGKREAKVLQGDPAQRSRLQGWLALRVRHQQGAALRQDRG